MDPVTILVSILASVVSASGIVAALSRIIRTVLSPQERAGRSFRQIIRDAFTEAPDTQPTLEERIQVLSGVMAQSAQLLEEITEEIDVRAAFAKQKKEEAEEAIAVANMHQEELDALRRVLRKEVSSEGNRGIRAAVILALFSFVLGAAVTVLVTLFVHPLYNSSPISPSRPASTSIGPTHKPSPTRPSLRIRRLGG
jgi:hypothetical protein